MYRALLRLALTLISFAICTTAVAAQQSAGRASASVSVQIRVTIPPLAIIDQVGSANFVSTIGGWDEYTLPVRTKANTSFDITLRVNQPGVAVRALTVGGTFVDVREGDDATVAQGKAGNGSVVTVTFRVPTGTSVKATLPFSLSITPAS